MHALVQLTVHYMYHVLSNTLIVVLVIYSIELTFNL